MDTVLNRTPVPQLQRLDEYPTCAETFTTGSEVLDSMLGSGLRTGMVWEVVGERWVFLVSYPIKGYYATELTFL